MITRRCELDHAARGVDHFREARLERAEIDAVRRFLQPREGEAVVPAAETVAVRTDAQQQVDDACRADPAVDLRAHLVDVEALPARARNRLRRELAEDEVVDRLLGQMTEAEQARGDRRAAPASSPAGPEPAAPTGDDHFATLRTESR